MRGKGEGSVFKDARGLWTAVVELPSSDGKRRRKTIRSKDKKTVLLKLAEVKGELQKRGDLPTSDQTVEQWFRYWYAEIVEKNTRPNTATNYRTVMEKYIIPTIGNMRLEKVSAPSIRKVTSRMVDELGMSSSYALNAHRIMSASFEVALREGRIGRNPAKLTSAPRAAKPALEALTLEEGIRVLEVLSRDSLMGASRATALLTGARRGEVLGLELDRVGDALDLSWQMQRIIWRHGCKTPCGRKRGNDCPDRRLKVPADYEYRNITGGLYWTRPKSSAGWRIIPLVDPLRSILEAHISAAPPNPWGLVFTHEHQPIDPDQESSDWRAFLLSIGMDKAVRLHDLRHTTVDLLLLAEVPPDIISEIMGHSAWRTTEGYKTRGNVIRMRQAMEQLSGLFTQRPGMSQGTLELDAS